MTEQNRSTGNVFEDLGFSADQASNLRVRAELSLEVQRMMTEQGWSQKEAAVHFGVPRTRLNDILRGRLDRVTIDRLVNMLAAVGREVRLSIRNEDAA